MDTKPNQTKQYKLFKPHEGQKQVIKALLDDNIFFVIAVIGRQWGKSFLALNMALYWAMQDEGCVVYWVSPKVAQASKIYTTIVLALKDRNIMKSNKGTSGDSEIVLINGSVIKFRSAAAEDSLRGESINYLIIDEATFIKKDTITTILLPMLNVKGKKCYISTTPRGKNWVFDWFKKGNEGDAKWKSFRFSSYDSPLANKELIDTFKEQLSDKLFQQEYNAEFVDNASVFNNIDELMCLEPIEVPNLTSNYYGGIDIGLKADAAVLSIVDAKGSLVKYYRWERFDTNDLMDEIIRISKIWKCRKILIEENNQGLPIYHMLRGKVNNLYTFYTGAKSKGDIINKLILLFNTKKVQLVKDELLRIELEAFIFKQTATGHIKYTADNGFHDDIVMSYAFAVEAVGNQINSTATQSIYIID